MTSKPVVVEEATVEELVETNQLLTYVNNLLEHSTISTDKVELIELPKDSILPTRFRFIDLSILSDMFSLLACLARQQILSSFATLKTRKKDWQYLCKLDAMNLSIVFIPHLRLTAPKKIVAEE